MPKNTVRVRVAIATDVHGRWSAAGWQLSDEPRDDNELSMMAAEGLDSPFERITFIEADVPLPEQATVEAKVEG